MLAPLTWEPGMIFKRRAPREFKVELGASPTINGFEAEGQTPQEILEEIYDQADLFPVLITIKGITETHVLQMNENGETSQVTDSGDHLFDTVEAEPSSPITDPEVKQPAQKSGRSFAPKFQLNKKTIAVSGVAALAVVVAFGGTRFFFGGAEANEQTWPSTLPEVTVSSTPFNESLGSKLWSLEPGDADSASWYAAGLLTTKQADRTIILRGAADGKPIATHKIESGQNLKEEIQWVAEFISHGKPAVGVRTSKSFVALTEDGKKTEWKIPPGYEVSIKGETPLLTNAKSKEDPQGFSFQALYVGRDKPVSLTVNRELTTRSVDDEWIVQLDRNSPLVALNPVDRTGEISATAVRLAPPAEGSTFVQHLDAGHGLSLSLWRYESQLYAAVHSLSGDETGEAKSFVPAPFSEQDAKSWMVGSGMELALLGPYAFSIATGELDEHISGSVPEKAFGQLVISKDQAGARQLTLDHQQYRETDRIIGLTDDGIALARLIDGSIAAYGKTGE